MVEWDAGKEVVEGEQGVGLAPAEGRLEVDDGDATVVGEALDGLEEQLSKPLRDERPPEELDGITVLGLSPLRDGPGRGRRRTPPERRCRCGHRRGA